MEPGTVVGGRWRVGAALGRGSRAATYRVVDEPTGRAAVLKAIRHGSASENARSDRELAALRGFRHPGVVELLDAGADGRTRWIVTAWVDGVPFPGAVDVDDWRTTLGVTARLCDVLAAVHGAGIVHRDLKPDNVLVDSFGRPVLLDFGLARGEAIGATVTADSILGTPRYLAPEQVLGQKVDGRADLYALGVMVWEALAGRPLTTGREALQRLTHRKTAPATPLATAAPQLPPRLCGLVDRLLATAARDRPPDARSVGAELRALLDGAEPEAASHLPLVGRTALLAELVRDVEHGAALDLWGPPGVGLSRLFDELERALLRGGRRVAVATPATRGLASLTTWLGEPSTPSRAWTELAAAMEARLRAGEVLLAPDLAGLDPASRRLLDLARGWGRVVRAADTPQARRVPPLTVEDLRALFAGPDRVLHLREDAARELHRRTAGLPAGVEAELTRWRRIGAARPTAAGIRVDRAVLEALQGEPGEPGARVARVDLAGVGDQAELLDWIAAARGPIDLARLAAACGASVWQVELEVQVLVDAGAVQRLADGRVDALVAPGGPRRAPDASRHRAYAAVREAADPARVHDLLLADDPEAAVDAALDCAAAAAAAGRHTDAFIVLAGVVKELTRPPSRAAALARALAESASRSGNVEHAAVAEARIRALALRPPAARGAPLAARTRTLLAELDGPDPGTLRAAAADLVALGEARRSPGLELLGRVLARGVAWRMDEPLERDAELSELTARYAPDLEGRAMLWDAGVAWRAGQVMPARRLAESAMALLAAAAPGPALVARAFWHALGGGSPAEVGATLATVLRAAPSPAAVEAAELMSWVVGPDGGLETRRSGLGALFADVRAQRLILVGREECRLDADRRDDPPTDR